MDAAAVGVAVGVLDDFEVLVGIAVGVGAPDTLVTVTVVVAEPRFTLPTPKAVTDSVCDPLDTVVEFQATESGGLDTI